MNTFIGEIISLAVAVSWTATAVFAEVASKRLGALSLNLIRMALSLLLLGVVLWATLGAPYPVGASTEVWWWLALSGLVGYVFGDWCLFNSYVVFGSRYGQLFMTLAPPVAGVCGWLFLGQRMSASSWLAMLVTLAGIALTILVRKGGDSHKLALNLPLKGVLFGIGAGIGQGVGLVISKIGLDAYSRVLTQAYSLTSVSNAAGACQASNAIDGPDEAIAAFMIPFAGTYIRAVAGFAGFFIIALCSRKLNTMKAVAGDRKGMTYAALTTIFGPFIGVSLSLMAVQFAPAGIASTLMALTPVFIIIPYSVIYRQHISLKETIGTLITVAGVALFFLL